MTRPIVEELAVKSFGFNPKQPFISADYYRYHFLQIHGPIALEMEEIRRYIQFHGTEQRLAPFARSMYIAHAECWFDSMESHASLAEHPSRDTARRDGLTLHDKPPGRQVELVTIEEVVSGSDVEPGSAGLTKGVLLIRKHHSVGSAEFHRWWGDALPDLVRATVPGLVRHVQSVARTDAYVDRNPVFDGVLELWWDDQSLLETGVDLTALANLLERSPISMQDSVSSVGTEIRLRWPGHTEVRRTPERDRISGVDVVRLPEWLLRELGPQV